jgi:hypothetical protein
MKNLLRPESPALVYAGVALAAIGFGLIGFSWAQTSSRDSVAFQVPYMLSGGFSGLGCIMLGATAVLVQVRRYESAVRRQQLERVISLLAAVSGAEVEQPQQQAEPEVVELPAVPVAEAPPVRRRLAARVGSRS